MDIIRERESRERTWVVGGRRPARPCEGITCTICVRVHCSKAISNPQTSTSFSFQFFYSLFFFKIFVCFFSYSLSFYLVLIPFSRMLFLLCHVILELVNDGSAQVYKSRLNLKPKQVKSIKTQFFL